MHPEEQQKQVFKHNSDSKLYMFEEMKINPI